MTAPSAKSVTKAVLSGFVREHSGLNLTQAKTLTDRLLGTYIVTMKPPPDPDIPVEPGQMWLHTTTRRRLRVTEVQSGPVYVPGDSVTSWGPQSILWQDADNGTAEGSAAIQLWRQNMSLIPAAVQPSTTAATLSSESETAT